MASWYTCLRPIDYCVLGLDYVVVIARDPAHSRRLCWRTSVSAMFDDTTSSKSVWLVANQSSNVRFNIADCSVNRYAQVCHDASRT